MTNGEKYETAQERAEAFRGYCKSKEDCKYCEFYYYDRSMCLNLWLDLEAEEEKSLNCPFCGGRTSYWGPTYDGGDIWVKCDNCGYGGSRHKKLHQAIAAHNRVAKKCDRSSLMSKVGHAVSEFERKNDTDKDELSIVTETDNDEDSLVIRVFGGKK